MRKKQAKANTEWTTPRARFRQWRRGRAFWAGVFSLVSGLLILFPPFASLKLGDAVITLNTLSGVSALIVGAVLVMCGVSFWARPQYRMPAGVVALLVSLVAIVTANLGSLLIGTLCGVIGAALGIAWSPEGKHGRHGKGDGPAPVEPVTEPIGLGGRV